MRVAQEFRARHDADPEVVASAPGRVNLIGEHLDYNGGPVLPMALERRTWVAAARRDDGRLVVESLQQDGDVRLPVADLDRDRVEGWAAYVVGVVWALAEPLGGGDDLPGLTLLVDGQVPLGAGLSSSAALECAVALATCAVVGRSLPGEEIVAACVRAENEYAGASRCSRRSTAPCSSTSPTPRVGRSPGPPRASCSSSTRRSTTS
jgi:galactokinase